jgi:hypothetical protein
MQGFRTFSLFGVRLRFKIGLLSKNTGKRYFDPFDGSPWRENVIASKIPGKMKTF